MSTFMQEMNVELFFPLSKAEVYDERRDLTLILYIKIVLILHLI
jgi:hypothetical protein